MLKYVGAVEKGGRCNDAGVEVEACERREGARREVPLDRGVGRFALSLRFWTDLASARGENKRATSTLKVFWLLLRLSAPTTSSNGMGAPPPDSHTGTGVDENDTTPDQHQLQQAAPPANMVSESSSPGSGSQRGRTCSHQGCIRRGFDRCTWGQPQPSGTATTAVATSTVNSPRRGGSFRGGRGGGGRGGMLGWNRQGPTPYHVDPAPAATAADVVDTVKKEDTSTQPQSQLKASDSATSSDEELDASQISARTQAQTGSPAQKSITRPAAPTGAWTLDRLQPVRFGESPGSFQGSKNSQSVQTPQTPAITTSTSIGEPQTGTDKKNDIGKQPQPNAPNPAPATTTEGPSFVGLNAKQDSSKAPEPSRNASQAASNINTAVPNGGSGTVAVGAKEPNNDHGGQTQPPGPPGLSVPACKTSFSTPGAQNGCDSAIETQPAKYPSQDDQSVQAAPGGAQAFSATAQSAEQLATRAQDTDKKNGNNTEPHQKGSAVAATSSSFAFGGSPGQAQPTFASGASPAPKTSFSSSPGLGAGRSSFFARFSRGATVGPESGPTTRNPITFGSTRPLYSPILFGVKGQGSLHGRASEPPPALNESTGESQGPPRKRYANNHLKQRWLKGADTHALGSSSIRQSWCWSVKTRTSSLCINM